MTESCEKTYRLCMASFADSAEGHHWKSLLGRDYELVSETLLLNLGRDLALLPDEIHGEHVSHLIETLLPARLPDALACAGRIPDFVLAWLGHLGREQGLARDWEWTSAIEAGREGYAAAMADPARPRLNPPAEKPHVRPGAKLGRNDPCPCGSGKKYKKCCARL